MTNEIAKQENTPSTLIEQALAKGSDIDVMERLFTLQERWEANQAKKAFDKAMADFQGECPIIEKKTKVFDRDGKLLYSYAKIESIVEQVGPFLTKSGLSYIFKPKETKDGEVTTICIAKHVDGHSEESEMSIKKGQGTSIQSSSQAVGGDVTFSKRYAFCNVFGIMTGDEDNDAKPDDQPEPVFIKEINEIKTMGELKRYHAKNGKKHNSLEYAKAINAKKEDVDMPVEKNGKVVDKKNWDVDNLEIPQG